MTYFLAYIFSVLDNINTVFLFIFIIFGIILLIVLCWYFDDRYNLSDEDKISIRCVFKVLSSIVIFSGFIVIFLPNQKQAAMIYILPKLADNKELQQTIEKIPQLANVGIESLIDIIKVKKDKKQKKI